MKKYILLLTGLCFSLATLALDNVVKIGVLYYQYHNESHTAEVVAQHEGLPHYDVMPAGDIEIPDHIYIDNERYEVTTLGFSVFEGCNDLTSVVIPNTVTKITSCAFSGCKGLQSVTVPNSVTEMGYSVFSYCM